MNTKSQHTIDLQTTTATPTLVVATVIARKTLVRDIRAHAQKKDLVETKMTRYTTARVVARASQRINETKRATATKNSKWTTSKKKTRQPSLKGEEKSESNCYKLVLLDLQKMVVLFSRVYLNLC